MNKIPPLPIRRPGSGPLHPAEAAAQQQLAATSQTNRTVSRDPASSAPRTAAPVTYTAQAPLILNGTVFSMPAASTTGDGYLRSSDWDIFSAKEPALGNPATDGFALVSTAAGVRSWARCSAQPHAISATTGTYTATSADEILTGDAAGGAFSITLPTAAGIAGRIYTVKRLNSGANAVTVATTGGQTIDGAATVALSAQWQTLRVVSDGANWLVV